MTVDVPVRVPCGVDCRVVDGIASVEREIAVSVTVTVSEWVKPLVTTDIEVIVRRVPDEVTVVSKALVGGGRVGGVMHAATPKEESRISAQAPAARCTLETFRRRADTTRRVF